MTHSRIYATLLAALVIAAAGIPSAASAETCPHDPAAHHAMMAAAASAPDATTPTEPGQAAFAAIAEIVGILESDPATDWSKVDIGALRDHLVDMERLVTETRVTETPIENGLEIVVGGPQEAVDSARRMVPAHAAMVAADRGWTVTVDDRGSDLLVRWTTADPAEVPRLRALGFYGMMVEGSHHAHHHLMIARGMNPHHGG